MVGDGLLLDANWLSVVWGCNLDYTPHCQGAQSQVERLNVLHCFKSSAVSLLASSFTIIQFLCLFPFTLPPLPPQVGEPSVPDTIQILRGLKQKYEDHHGVHITDRALVVAAELSDR